MFVRVYVKGELMLLAQRLWWIFRAAQWLRWWYWCFDAWSAAIIDDWTLRIQPLVRWKSYLLDLFFPQWLVNAVPRWLPNLLGFARIALVPPIIWLIYRQQSTTALLLFIIAASFDALDGEYARRKNCQSDFGRILDPLVDKALFLSLLIVLANDTIPTLLFRSVIALELVLVAFGAIGWLQSRGRAQKRLRKRRLGANAAGKLKFNAQAVAIGLFLIGQPTTATFMLVLALVLAACSIFGHCFILARNDH